MRLATSVLGIIPWAIRELPATAALVVGILPVPVLRAVRARAEAARGERKGDALLRQPGLNLFMSRRAPSGFSYCSSSLAFREQPTTVTPRVGFSYSTVCRIPNTLVDKIR